MRKRRLFVSYGRDARAMVGELLEAGGVGAALDRDRGVLLKPNLVLAKPAASGATTHPQVASGVIEYLLAHGVRAKRIRIAESSWTGGDTGQAFRVCGYEDLARRYGVALVDLKQDSVVSVRVDGQGLAVCGSVLQGDTFVNLPVLKGHSQTGMTCALKNLKGCIPDREKRRFHREGLHVPIALLARAVPQDLILVDAMCGDPASELGGSPVAMDRLILGWDPVLVDSYAAQVMGFQPDRIEHIARAAALGVGSMNIAAAEITALGDPREAQAGGELGAGTAAGSAAGRAETAAGPVRAAVRNLTRHIEDRQACSACYGNTLHALRRLQEEGLLSALPEPVRIGQGYRGRERSRFGVGACAAAGRGRPRGCPPTGQQILEFLRGSLG